MFVLSSEHLSRALCPQTPPSVICSVLGRVCGVFPPHGGFLTIRVAKSTGILRAVDRRALRGMKCTGPQDNAHLLLL